MFQSGDIVIYEYKQYKYKLKLLGNYDHSNYWDALIVEMIKPHIELDELELVVDDLFLRHLTPLEQALN